MENKKVLSTIEARLKMSTEILTVIGDARMNELGELIKIYTTRC